MRVKVAVGASCCPPSLQLIHITELQLLIVFFGVCLCCGIYNWIVSQIIQLLDWLTVMTTRPRTLPGTNLFYEHGLL